MAWTSSNSVSVGDPTKKSAFDELFDNILIGRDSTTGAMISAGTTADGLTITGTAPATPDADTIYEKNIINAWVKFTGVADTIDNAFNVFDITDNGTGDYDVNFDLDFTNVDYVISATVMENSARIVTVGTAPATSAVQILCFDSGGTATEPTRILVVAMGDQ